MYVLHSFRNLFVGVAGACQLWCGSSLFSTLLSFVLYDNELLKQRKIKSEPMIRLNHNIKCIIILNKVRIQYEGVKG